MSLTLRAACEPVLEKYRLTQFYVNMSEHARSMTLNNPCGGTTITIHSIQFSRTNPTIKECDYAATLLEQFLTKNKKDIQELIDQADILASMKEPEGKGCSDTGDPDGFTINTETLNYQDRVNGVVPRMYLTYMQDKFLICINPEGHIKYVRSRDSVTKLPVKDINDFKIDEDRFKHYRDILKQIKDYRIQRAKVKRLREDLNSCEVKF